MSECGPAKPDFFTYSIGFLPCIAQHSNHPIYRCLVGVSCLVGACICPKINLFSGCSDHLESKAVRLPKHNVSCSSTCSSPFSLQSSQPLQRACVMNRRRLKPSSLKRQLCFIKPP